MGKKKKWGWTVFVQGGELRSRQNEECRVKNIFDFDESGGGCGGPITPLQEQHEL
jgi:hypothetical protein